MENKVLIPTETYNAIISLETNLDKEFMFYFIHLLQTFPPVQELEYLGYIYISSKFLKKKKGDYQYCIRDLEKYNIIKVNPKYRINAYPKSYNP